MTAFAQRPPTGRGRPHSPETVASVRALVEGTDLTYREIAGRHGIHPRTVASWSHAGGWRDAAGCRADLSAGEEAPAPSRPRLTRRGYDPETRARAYGLLTQTRLSLDRIARACGVSPVTLWRWGRDGGWTRPTRPKEVGPWPYRSRRLLGRPYGGGVREEARRLVTGTTLNQARIAAQLGVSQDTVSRWTRAGGWQRPGAYAVRLAARRRTAPTARTGNLRNAPYAPEVVAAARELYEQTVLPTANIAARVKVSAVTVGLWARRNGWTRPRDMPDADGPVPRRRRR